MIERKKRKEKIESKGAYAYDLHKAIRAVNSAQRKGDLEKTGLCLNALYDICAPEIREAVNDEWLKIEKKYHDRLERYRNAKYEVCSLEREAGWKKDRYGNPVCRIYGGWNLTQSGEAQLKSETRNSLLRKIWNEIFHERLQACIDCLDRHGELRKWRDVEYGKL